VDLLKLHHLAMTTRSSINHHDIDEALWTAYRRSDKNAVAENLLGRYLPGLTMIPNAVRESERPKSLKNGFGLRASILLAHLQ
jgi:hypothetical protein